MVGQGYPMVASYHAIFERIGLLAQLDVSPCTAVDLRHTSVQKDMHDTLRTTRKVMPRRGCKAFATKRINQSQRTDPWPDMMIKTRGKVRQSKIQSITPAPHTTTDFFWGTAIQLARSIRPSRLSRSPQALKHHGKTHRRHDHRLR